MNTLSGKEQNYINAVMKGIPAKGEYDVEYDITTRSIYEENVWFRKKHMVFKGYLCNPTGKKEIPAFYFGVSGYDLTEQAYTLDEIREEFPGVYAIMMQPENELEFALCVEDDYDDYGLVVFPEKDRETSRKHAASRRKAKQKSRSRKATAFQRSCELYNAGLDKHGQTFSARRLAESADLDELDYIKGNGPVMDDEPTEPVWWEFSAENYLSLADALEAITDLENKGISFPEIKESVITTLVNKEDREARRREIYAARPIIGYAVSCPYDDGILSVFPTRELAKEAMENFEASGWVTDDMRVEPVRKWTPELIREIKALGFQPFGY